MDFPELLVILAIAFIFLGPEKMIEVATKLGEFLRKIRETWDELRYQLYLESISRKIDEQSRELPKVEEPIQYETSQEEKPQEVNKNDGESGTSQDASDGASEGAKKQVD
ncbi:MAG: twin-arginine translocase TatA/TatE family subunit [Aquificaceae bacterium]|nr:twin-arginine translocase TatA/TatE family subunit [Aquificaceae bacterium]MCX8076239.1 twin-arginine translocase TatA/TatE family subunit [Aquificaceae bacterium]MDW8095774.1 twin-arginine translocase TatA/TatE family subunit [Aquificaceae bacterium]